MYPTGLAPFFGFWALVKTGLHGSAESGLQCVLPFPCCCRVFWTRLHLPKVCFTDHLCQAFVTAAPTAPAAAATAAATPITLWQATAGGAWEPRVFDMVMRGVGAGAWGLKRMYYRLQSWRNSSQPLGFPHVCKFFEYLWCSAPSNRILHHHRPHRHPHRRHPRRPPRAATTMGAILLRRMALATTATEAGASRAKLTSVGARHSLHTFSYSRLRFRVLGQGCK
jgi:hypothetical protein